MRVETAQFLTPDPFQPRTSLLPDLHPPPGRGDLFRGCTDRISNTRHANANLAEVKFLRSVYSSRQLEAVLLDFWLNHLNVDGAQRIARWAEQDYEQVSLRRIRTLINS